MHNTRKQAQKVFNTQINEKRIVDIEHIEEAGAILGYNKQGELVAEEYYLSA